MYQIRMCHTCRCTINSTAVSLSVFSLVVGGTHDTYVPPKKQLYRYLFERSEFLIATCKKKKLTVCVSGCSVSLGFSVEKIVLVLV